MTENRAVFPATFFLAQKPGEDTFFAYVQFVLPRFKTKKSDLSERDFHAFNETLIELQPDIAIVWGCVINTRLKEDNVYLLNDRRKETEDYVVDIKLPEMDKKVTIINPNHPSDIGGCWSSEVNKFKKYLAEELAKQTMAANIFGRYVWLLDTLRRRGRLMFEEINRLWQRSGLSYGEGDELAIRTFHNHRAAILDIFQVDIRCDAKDGYRYFIANPERIEGDAFGRSSIRDSGGRSGRLILTRASAWRSFSAAVAA